MFWVPYLECAQFCFPRKSFARQQFKSTSVQKIMIIHYYIFIVFNAWEVLINICELASRPLNMHDSWVLYGINRKQVIDLSFTTYRDIISISIIKFKLKNIVKFKNNFTYLLF